MLSCAWDIRKNIRLALEFISYPCHRFDPIYTPALLLQRVCWVESNLWWVYDKAVRSENWLYWWLVSCVITRDVCNWEFFLTGPIWARTVFCIDIGYIGLIYVVKKHLPHIYMIFLNVKENNHVHLFYGTQKLSKTFRIIRDSFKLLEPQILWIRSIFLKIVSSWRPYWFWEKAWWGHRLHPRPRWSKNQEQIDHDEE